MARALHSAVVDTLGREITSGELRPGQALTLERLQHRFGVSRTVAREGMRSLEQLQLVTSGRRVGIVVRPTVDWDVLDPRVIRWRLDGPGRRDQLRSLTELRAAVEPLAAASAARRASADESVRLLRIARRLREPVPDGGVRNHLELDIAFHVTVLQASRNEMFAALTDVVAEVLRDRSTRRATPAPPPEVLDLHETVAVAISEHDAPGAELAMRRILSRLGVAIRAELDPV
ncbi:FadR/GntR family transcriptional regulator [Cellulomonas fimi]|uniref:FadR family transcriptional regulator n=1 Tax=Cellulomonas fimi TaxID=1708 RepID=A0A7Y0M079_CELFI|nr:FCD domain-containing protein [Cellulomonas fimi]NMR21110.1 FadR family transcriptional regulator [Cellulomonas fimi]